MAITTLSARASPSGRNAAGRRNPGPRAWKRVAALAVLMCQAIAAGCQHKPDQRGRDQARWSGWIEEAAVQRGYIKPGDFAQFGCPPGWRGVDDTAAALRGGQASTKYMGTDPPPRDGTVTCVAQKEFELPSPFAAGVAVRDSAEKQRDSARRPLSPVWVHIGADRTTIGFRSELPLNAAIYIGQDTPCGPRLTGVRLGDLLKWLSDPESATKRDFLGLISAGC